MHTRIGGCGPTELSQKCIKISMSISSHSQVASFDRAESAASGTPFQLNGFSWENSVTAVYSICIAADILMHYVMYLLQEF